MQLNACTNRCSSSNGVLDDTMRAVSSAYKFTLQLFGTALGRSFIKRLKSNGPNMDPRGTPQVTGSGSDLA